MEVARYTKTEIVTDGVGNYTVLNDLDVLIETTDKAAAIVVWKLAYTLECVEKAIETAKQSPSEVFNLSTVESMLIVGQHIADDEVIIGHIQKGYVFPPHRDTDYPAMIGWNDAEEMDYFANEWGRYYFDAGDVEIAYGDCQVCDGKTHYLGRINDEGSYRAFGRCQKCGCGFEF